MANDPILTDDLTPLLEWVKAKDPDAIVGYCGSAMRCPIATFIQETQGFDEAWVMPKPTYTYNDPNTDHHPYYTYPDTSLDSALGMKAWLTGELPRSYNTVARKVDNQPAPLNATIEIKASQLMEIIEEVLNG